ncbi:MAG: diguanylate cyclase, partial [Candidatus Manganitrophaceae bacterium]
MNGGTIRVLLVEDNPADARLAQELLVETAGGRFKVTETARLAKAIGTLKKESFDVILLDLSLPDSRGLEPLFRIRGEAPGTPLVILSGRSDEQTAIKAIQEGAQDYLIKGRISGDLLAHAITYAIERKRTEEALRNAKAFSENLIQTANVIILSLDTAGNIDIFNQAAEKITGYTLSELKGKNWFEILVPKERYPHVWEEFNRLLAGGIPKTFENPILTKSGEERHIMWQNNQIKIDGKVVATISFGNDITERKKAEALLCVRARRQEIIAELGQRALSGGPLPTLMNEAVTLVARTLEVEYCNVLEPLPGEGALLLTAGCGWEEGRIGAETVGMFENSQAAYTLANNGPVVVVDFETERRFRASPLLLDHEVVSGLSVLIPGQDYPHGVLGAHTTRRRTFREEDVLFLQSIANVLAAAIDRKKAEERIEHQAYHDALTGLPNRLLLEDRLSIAVAHAHRNHQMLAIILVDLDRFKVINDTLGHAIGDELLRGVATRFLSSIRDCDTVARMGGDEFAILLPELSCGDIAVNVAERIFASLKQPFSLDGHDLYVTASLGMAVYPEAGLDVQTLLRHADIALYRAKEQGRNTLRSFSPTMNARAFERLSLES